MSSGYHTLTPKKKRRLLGFFFWIRFVLEYKWKLIAGLSIARITAASTISVPAVSSIHKSSSPHLIPTQSFYNRRDTKFPWNILSKLCNSFISVVEQLKPYRLVQFWAFFINYQAHNIMVKMYVFVFKKSVTSCHS